MKRLLSKYGAFIALIIFILSTILIATHLTVRTKQAVTVVIDPAQQCRVYTSSMPSSLFRKDDTLTVNLSGVGDCTFRMIDRRSERQAEVITVCPLQPNIFRNQTQGNTLLTGIIFTEKQTMWEYLADRIFYTPF